MPKKNKMYADLISKLHKAIQDDNMDLVESMIKADSSLCQSRESVSKGDTPLHVAARMGTVKMVAFLLEYIGVDSTNSDGKTALHEASSASNMDVMRLLIEKGSSINFLKMADWTPLMMACAKTDIEPIKLLVAHGASLTRVNKDGWNAFHIAAREGNVEIVNFLLQQDSTSCNNVSKNGRTPLHTAAINGCMQVVKLMLTSDICSCDVNCKDSCGSSPLMDSLRSGNLEIADMLLTHGGSITQTNSLGQSCVHTVCEAGIVSSLEWAIDHLNGDIIETLQQTDNRSLTCLHLAAKEGKDTVIARLIQYGVDITTPDPKGRTALDIAIACRQMACIELLQSATGV